VLPELPDTRPAGTWRAAGTSPPASPSRPAEAGWRRPRPVVPRLVVPAYFHPAVAPADWARMARQASHIRAVILNPASGPGDQPDPAYFPALQPLRDAGVTIAGYVDTNYGQRPLRAALADIERYQDSYGITGVLFDRVSAVAGDLRHYAVLARRARKLGAQTVVFNHGVHPHEGYARHADILGTFEGPWNVYLQQAVPQWTRSWPADRFYHVVYSVPPEHLASAFMVAGRRRAGCVYVTDHGGGNPYNRLPALVPAPAAQQWVQQRQERR
jgi:Spherulation-specific family 4